MEAQRGFVVVSGLPASGKSTVANHLALMESTPVIDKDDLLELLFAQYESVDRELRHRLSREADSMMKERVQLIQSAILVSHWKHPALSSPSGTPTEWLFELPHVTEIYCACDPEVAVERFLHRERHAGHGDARATQEELREQFLGLSALGPIGLNRVLTVDTGTELDISAIVEWLGWC